MCDNCGGEVVQRPDDVAEAIAERLAAYEHETAPLHRPLRERGLLETVDGDGTADEVSDRLCAVIDAGCDA